MEKLRWGVLSTAKIGCTNIIPAFNMSAFGEVVAIASRTQKSADKAARKLNIERAYASYDDLLSDPGIDAIYNPLPNHLHVPWSIKALKAGKHVLCEKPLGMNAEDVKSLIDITKQYPRLKMMEAFMYRFHPQWEAARELVLTDIIGKIRTIHSHFAYNNRDTNNIRNHLMMGGGALMDIGCYCISLARFLYNAEPSQVLGQMTPYVGQEVDCFVSGIMEFEQGNATFTASTKIEPAQYVEITGELGSIFIPLPFNPGADKKTYIVLTRNKTRKKIAIPASNHYRNMGDAFALSVLNNTPVPTPLDDALANMVVIDAVFKSIQQKCWVDIS